MASFNNAGAPSFETLLVQNLMDGLHRRPPSRDTDSFLSLTLDDLLSLDDPLSPETDSSDSPVARRGGGRGREQTLLAREEAKLEKEIVRVIRSGAARESLKPNSGQSVAIGEHSICVGFHEEPGSGYRVWEWHGHIMLFDVENGFCPEYIYGNYLQRVPLSAGLKEGDEKEKEKEKIGVQLGLRDLIGDEKDSTGNGGRRVLHRNSLTTGLGR